MGIVIGTGVFLFATAFAGCAGMGGSHVDCNVVRLQSQSGRSNAEIASAIGASEADVAKCPPAPPVAGAEGSGGPPNASEYGVPAGMEGSEGGGGGGGGAAPAPQQ